MNESFLQRTVPRCRDSRKLSRPSVALAALGICALAGCQPGGESPLPLGRLSGGLTVGKDDSVIVDEDGRNLPSGLASVWRAVGRSQGIACTGTHIGRGLVVTAAHCVTALSLSECADTAFEWVQGAEGEAVVAGSCQRIVYAELNELRDIAIVEVDHAPNVAAPVDWCRVVGKREQVSILGYPNRGALHWSDYCRLDGPIGKNRAIHVCDTNSGSSGSPLFSRETAQLVGVHIGVFNRLNQANLLFPILSDLTEWRCGCESTPSPLSTLL